MMFSRADMIDLMWQDGLLLRQMAVLASFRGAVSNRLSAECTHELWRGPGFAHRHFCFGMQQVDELPYAEVFLQGKAFFGRDRPAIVFLEKLLNLLDRLRLKLEREKRPSRIRM